MIWTAHKPSPSTFGPKRQWYSAKVLLDGYVPSVLVSITPYRPTVTSHWGKGRKTSKSYVGYRVTIGRFPPKSGFGTVKAAKEFAEEFIAAEGPAERAAVLRAWR